MSKSNNAVAAKAEVVVKEEKVNQVLANEDMIKVMEEYKTKSAAIRYFASKDYSRSDIAKAMGIRYQHVRNVLVADAEKAEAKA